MHAQSTSHTCKSMRRFTNRARKVMKLADMEARRLNHRFIGTEHILFGLIIDSDGVAACALELLKFDLDKYRSGRLKLVQPGPDVATVSKLFWTAGVERCIEQAIQSVCDLKHNHVGTEHLLLGLVAEPECVAAQILLDFGIKPEMVKKEVFNLLGTDGVIKRKKIEESAQTLGFRGHLPKEQLQTNADIMQQRHDKIETLKFFYQHNLVEDAQNKTDFDHAVLAAFNDIMLKFCPPKLPTV